MATHLTALKVKIGLRQNGEADHPDFGKLQIVIDSGMDWSHWVDANGGGWRYDASSGHREADLESPLGVQMGMLLVPAAFADQAVAAFDGICERLTETEATDFYDRRHSVRLPAIRRDQEVLDALYGERARLVKAAQATTPIDSEIAKAEDPDLPNAGVRRIRQKTYGGLKAMMGFQYDEPRAGPRPRIRL